MVNSVLILGARAPIALELVRSFSKKGCKVYLADSLRLTLARWSKYVEKYYLLSSPRFETDKFIAELLQIIENENITHLIPTCEEVFYVSKFKNKFSCKVWASEIDIMQQLHNKLDFTQFTRPFLKTPTTLLLSEFNDWDNSKNYVFKPIYSRFASKVMINQTIKNSFFTEKDKKNWIVQAKVNGKEICVYSIWEEGRLKAFNSYHPLYRAGKGAGIFFEPIFHQKTFEMVNDFAKNIKFTGQLSFDVILDSDSNPFFIECNPRGTSGAHLINTQLADCFLENQSIILTEQKEYAIKYALLLLYPLSFLKKRTLKSKDVIFDIGDILPFLLQFLSLFEITFIKFRKKITWLEATTGDIEWNGDNR